LTKNELGHILGDIFTSSSGHPAGDRDAITGFSPDASLSILLLMII
jgi:hypothetical protein